MFSRGLNQPFLRPKLLSSFGRYIQEGSTVTVVGIVRRNNEMTTIVQPPEVISTGCLWQKLFLPVDIDGLILSVSRRADLSNSINQESVQNLGW